MVLNQTKMKIFSWLILSLNRCIWSDVIQYNTTLWNAMGLMVESCIQPKTMSMGTSKKILIPQHAIRKSHCPFFNSMLVCLYLTIFSTAISLDFFLCVCRNSRLSDGECVSSWYFPFEPRMMIKCFRWRPCSVEAVLKRIHLRCLRRSTGINWHDFNEMAVSG